MTDNRKPALRMCSSTIIPPVVPHQRLLSEATQLGTEEILQENPTEYSLALEQAFRHGVRQAVLYYARGLDSMSRQLRPLNHAKSTQA
jgi:hypothetical protein